MVFVDCLFCHKRVFFLLYPFHRAFHTWRRPDGQMNAHITVHPQGRFQGSLDGVPRAYLHVKCQGCTEMPEEIIRSYLVNPFLYNDRTFCCGCGDYFDTKELFWVETGQCMADYNRELREEYIRKYGSPPPKPRI